MTAQLISVVVPCFNERDVFPALETALLKLGNQLAGRYDLEFILIDDGSTDSTWEQIVSFASRDLRVRAVGLSRNFGQQAALTCGYDFARGDAIVSLDADLQDPPEVLLEMIREWENGADIVYAIRTLRKGESVFKRVTASFFYKLIRTLGETNSPVDSGDFRLMSKRCVVALRKLREKHRYVRGLVGWIGFRSALVHYERRPRAAGKSKYTFARMIQFALDAIVSSSIVPLRLAYILAVLISLPFWGYLLYTLIMHFFFDAPLVPGWSSLILSVIVLGAVILICIGIMGEYLGRVYEQVKNRPLYLIREVENEISQQEDDPIPLSKVESNGDRIKTTNSSNRNRV